MIEEIVQLKQKTVDLLKQNYQLRQDLEAKATESKLHFINFIKDILEAYDQCSTEQKDFFQKILEKNEILRIPMSIALNDNDYTTIISSRPDNQKSNGTIVEFIKEGFVWQEQVIRKAEVVTVKN